METTDKAAGRQVVCSGCLQVLPESFINVIPYFNCDSGGYVVTYCCERCWVSSLEEIRTRLANTENETEISSAALLFERHGVVLHEFKRGDPTPIVRKRLSQMLDLLQSRAIRLAVGPLPLDMAAPALPDTTISPNQD